MKRLSLKMKRNIILGIIALVCVLLIILIVKGISSLMGRSVDTTAGLEYIRQEEAGDVAEIETKISLLEQQEYRENDQRSIKEKYAGSVVMGDSIAKGFAAYDVLNAANVVAQTGAHLTELGSQIEDAKEMSPQVVFISLGENDVIATGGDTDLFISQYSEVLDQVSRELPEANVFVNSIFPAQQKAIDKEPSLANIPAYNEALQEFCSGREIGYIDNTELVQEQYYEADGQHFKGDFYPVWAEHMAEVAQL